MSKIKQQNNIRNIKDIKITRIKFKKFHFNHIQLILANSLSQSRRGKGIKFRNTNDIIRWLKDEKKRAKIRESEDF
ncbi:MAG: hypothetical protein VR72_08525 [Clostridiaceae bacterium BRH_c20a]|nr:MAG: hypothetical protein VR72_08525 [Clostridiaceae bacterium BRH_c20a]